MLYLLIAWIGNIAVGNLWQNNYLLSLLKQKQRKKCNLDLRADIMCGASINRNVYFCISAFVHCDSGTIMKITLCQCFEFALGDSRENCLLMREITKRNESQRFD